MGIVAQARHLRLNTTVALKFIRPELLSSPDVVSRFEREARAACRLRSPHANRVLEFERLADGACFMVLEFLEGETLEERRARQAPTAHEVARWMRQACLALAEAHAQGIVHRDLKPSNLFLRRGPEGESVVVLDFGVAKSSNPDIEEGLAQTTQGVFVGSPSFMSPEQLGAPFPLDGRADVWALGATMYVLLTGRLAFPGKDLVEVASNIRHGKRSPLPAQVSPAMARCIDRCLQVDPAQRFESIEALAQALDTLGRSPAAREPEEAAPAGPRSRRLAIAGGVVALVGLALWATREATVVTAPASTPAAAPSEVTPVRADAPAALEVQPASLPVPALEAPPVERPRPVRPRPPAANRSAPPAVAQPGEAAPPDAGVDDVFGVRR
jgi:serine/threonine protein kinase